MRFRRIKRFLNKTNDNPGNNRKKVGLILFATSIGLFFLFAGRLTYIVAVGDVAGTSLAEKTKALYQGSRVVKAKRGTIYDRNGNVIAVDATSYSAYAVLSKTYVSGKTKLYAQEAHFDQLATILHDVLGLDKADVLKRLKEGVQDEKWQVEFGNGGKNMTLEKKQAIEAAMKSQKIAGIYFDEHPARTYPNGNFASYLVGYAQNEEVKGQESVVGKMGIEAAYDDILRGKDGEIVYEKDNYQNPLAGTVAQQTAAEDGQDIYTTLDLNLQSYTEDLLDNLMKELEPTNVTVTLMEAKTGNILAMSQRPSFNPETKEGIDKDGFVWQNLAVEDAFEPGSTMKVMTTSAAVNEGVFDENETYLSGEIKVYDATIQDHDQGAKGILNMRQALTWSSNTGMVRLEQKLEDQRWTNYLKRFGFGQSTHSGLPNESAGTLPTANPVDMAMSSYGQALNVSVLQMLRAYTAVANDGKMLQPQYVSKIVNNNTNKERITEPEVVGNPISAETAAKVREYMRGVVEDPNYGTAYGDFGVEGYHMSAKTGTAEIYDPQNGGYLRGEYNYLYSVAEIIPTEDPQYILFLTVKQPKHYPQKKMGELTNPLLKRALEFSNVNPSDQGATAEKVTVPDYRNMTTSEAASDATKSLLQPVVIGTGDKVKAQSTASGTKLMPGEKLILLTDSQEHYMPDVGGWSKADLIKLGKLLNIKVNFQGDGYAVSQSIAPYALIEGASIDFTLSQ